MELHHFLPCHWQGQRPTLHQYHQTPSAFPLLFPRDQQLLPVFILVIAFTTISTSICMGGPTTRSAVRSSGFQENSSTNVEKILIKARGSNKQQCNKICCTAEIVPRGQPVKSRDECNPNDIGLHFEKLSTMDDNKRYKLMTNIWKPPPDYIYSQHVGSGRHWQINSSYLDESSGKYYSWLR